jgi:phosphoserine phosphatase
MNKVNVYDFDKTIYKGDSSADFWIFSIKRHPKIFIKLPQQILFGILYITKFISKERFKEVFFSFLKFIPDVDTEVNEFWSLNKKKIAQWYIEKSEPGKDVIISASPEFLLQYICDKLKVRLIATKMDKNTGILNSPNCFGKEKLKRFKETYKDMHIANFYSDSKSDKPLASIADKSYLIKWRKLN